jgi:type II secretory pathway pseudopilin PulG
VTRATGRLRAEDGLTLVEVLLAMTLMLVVLGATLGTFNQFERNVKTNELQNEAQEQARRGLDLMARDLRNLASPTVDLPLAVDLDGASDVIFQSEGKDKDDDSLNLQNTTRVRYCLNKDTGTIYRQTQTWKTLAAPPAPASAACPSLDAGWGRTISVAHNVVNADRPVFTYNSTIRDRITEVTSQVWVDVNPTRLPEEVDLQTTVFLRNQNRMPSAVFTWAPMPETSIFLNASESVDPEEKPLKFSWYDMTAEPINGKFLGDGIVLTVKAPAPGPRTIKLVVQDATLKAEFTDEVCATATGVAC